MANIMGLGSGGGVLELVANVADGATVTTTIGNKTVTGVSVDGKVRLKIPHKGKWTVSAVKALTDTTKPVEIS